MGGVSIRFDEERERSGRAAMLASASSSFSDAALLLCCDLSWKGDLASQRASAAAKTRRSSLWQSSDDVLVTITSASSVRVVCDAARWRLFRRSVGHAVSYLAALGLEARLGANWLAHPVLLSRAATRRALLDSHRLLSLPPGAEVDDEDELLKECTWAFALESETASKL